LIRDFPEKDAACGVGGDGPYSTEITVILVVIEGETKERAQKTISRRNRFSLGCPSLTFKRSNNVPFHEAI